MTRTHKILLFYAGALLAGFDVHAVIQRFFVSVPDPVAWEKVFIAILLQLVVAALALAYFAYLGRAKALDTRPHLILDGLRLRYLPVLGLGMLAALSVTILYNAVNCGSHPLPANRGMSTCPR
jgi:hypothetical protein